MGSWLEAIERLEQANARLAAAAKLDDVSGISSALAFRESALEALFYVSTEAPEPALVERLGNAFEAGETILENLLAVRQSLRQELTRLHQIGEVQGAALSQHFASLIDFEG